MRKKTALERMKKGFKRLLAIEARDEMIKYKAKFLSVKGESHTLDVSSDKKSLHQS
ncbi:hypothetical protein [Bartonella queenslandensis]|uniref:hypothetical protein n=1 Tax=Bartonella queenslandensis TaxID=481138 RepID=UPI0002D82404|nr:hypothetical protein [Bartonella queenslandensis]